MSDVVYREPRTPSVPPGGMELLERDMTAIFSADCTLGQAQQKLAEINQWLPIDGNPDATLGALLESNSTGPLRLGFGGWRDLLLGAQFLNGKGELITAGGRTVKNVAGYDLTKFLVGSFGIFGRTITLTTRTHRKPDSALLVRSAPGLSTLVRLLATHLRPQWSLLTHDSLMYGYLGDQTTIDWYASNMTSAGSVETSRRTLQDDIDHRASHWGPGSGPLSFRASVPPARLKTFVDGIGHSDWVADPAFGIVLSSANDDADRVRLRGVATVVGGAIHFGADAESLDISTNPAERQIIERLKTAFDPQGRLKPLPWQRS